MIAESATDRSFSWDFHQAAEVALVVDKIFDEVEDLLLLGQKRCPFDLTEIEEAYKPLSEAETSLRVPVALMSLGDYPIIGKCLEALMAGIDEVVKNIDNSGDSTLPAMDLRVMEVLCLLKKLSADLKLVGGLEALEKVELVEV